MYICITMYIYLYICMCVFIYVYTFMYLRIYVYTYTCRCRYIHIRISYIPTIFWPWRCLAKSSGATPSNTLQSCSTWHLITRLPTQQRTKSWRMSDGTGWGGWGERKDTEKCESKLHAAPSRAHTHTHTQAHTRHVFVSKLHAAPSRAHTHTHTQAHTRHVFVSMCVCFCVLVGLPLGVDLCVRANVFVLLIKSCSLTFRACSTSGSSGITASSINTSTCPHVCLCVWTVGLTTSVYIHVYLLNEYVDFINEHVDFIIV